MSKEKKILSEKDLEKVSGGFDREYITIDNKVCKIDGGVGSNVNTLTLEEWDEWIIK